MATVAVGKVNLKEAGRTENARHHSTSPLETKIALSGCPEENQRDHPWTGPELRKPREGLPKAQSKWDPDPRPHLPLSHWASPAGYKHAALSTHHSTAQEVEWSPGDNHQGRGVEMPLGPEQEKL